MASYSNDWETIKAAINKDKEAEGRIYTLYKKIVESICYKMVKVDDVEDLAQECFIKVFKNLNTFEGNSTLQTWICTIAVNEARMFLRSAKTKALREVEGVEVENLLTFSPQPRLEKKLVDEALQELSPRRRQVFMMKTELGLSHEEIGKILNITRGTSKSLQLHACKQLRKILNKKGYTRANNVRSSIGTSAHNYGSPIKFHLSSTNM